MSRIRLFPLVIFLLFMTFTLRLGDFVMQVAMGREDVKLESVTALAQDAQAPTATASTSSDKSNNSEQNTGRMEIPERSNEPPKEVTVTGLDADPFVPAFSEEEVRILQSLSKRREQLEQRERDLEQREKLLQAAEKKVEEKVAELAALQKNIEKLLGEQQDIENDRLTQLVKIYENMKPKDAATIFNEMNFDVLLSIIDRMAERRVAPILAAMDPVRAREVSARLAEYRSLPRSSSASSSNKR